MDPAARVTGILSGVLGGNRALLIGWFLPSAINILLFGLLADPRLSGLGALGDPAAPVARPAVYTLVGTVVTGLLLAALQSPLYRVLEGYLAWPRPLAALGTRRHRARKQLLHDRLQGAGLVLAQERGELDEAGHAALAAFRAHPVTRHYLDADARRGAIGLAVLEERLHRYPAADEQIAPTRLGNAIRRLEEYGYDRFRLDTQVLWHELTAAAPDQARKQEQDARTGVDFFVAMLTGHLLGAVGALVELACSQARLSGHLAVAAGCLPAAALVWYRTAVTATDEWAGAVHALVNLGRAPLAAALGLALPGSLDNERALWSAVGDLVLGPYGPEAAELDRHRPSSTPPRRPRSRGWHTGKNHGTPR